MRIHLFTLFPHWFDGPLGESVIDRARQKGILDIETIDFRAFAHDKHRTVDDAPYGGGGGMVLRPDPLAEALDRHAGAPGTEGRAHVIYLSPRGRVFNQQVAIELAAKPRIALVCGHYESVDQRLIDTRVDEEMSLGDFVMTGGEIAAMAVVDAVARMLPGTLGNDTSALRDSFMNGLLEGPHYTRPEVFESRPIPEVLTSGNHGAIEAWREAESLRVTRERRPELYDTLALQPDDIRRLARRARPIVVYRSDELDPAKAVLFVSRAIRAQPEWWRQVCGRRSHRGLPGTRWRWQEWNELRVEDEQENRRILREDLAEQGGAEPSTFFRWMMQHSAG